MSVKKIMTSGFELSYRWTAHTEIELKYEIEYEIANNPDGWFTAPYYDDESMTWNCIYHPCDDPYYISSSTRGY